MTKIAIYYIATNSYITFFDSFVRGIENFYHGVPKKVVLITNHNDDFSVKSKEGIEIIQRHIDHYYWPIPALFKMFYIDKFFADDCDFHFYFNANFILTKGFAIKDTFDMCFTPHYMSNRLPFYVINYGNNNKCIVPPSSAMCHISRDEIPQGAKYCQACFFGGRVEKMKHLLLEVNMMIKEDLKRHIIPIWQDETYMNKYLLKNFWNDNRIGDVQFTSIYQYGELLDKNKFFNKFELE